MLARHLLIDHSGPVSHKIQAAWCEPRHLACFPEFIFPVQGAEASEGTIERGESLERLLERHTAINDNMTDFILLLDHQSQVIFTNKALADTLEIPASDLHGKGLLNIFGPDSGKKIDEMLQNCQGKELFSKEISFDIKGQMRNFSATCLTVPYEFDNHESVLVTLTDVTLLQEAQIKNELLMKQIVTSLMRAIDLHDPYSANHSSKTFMVATAVARAMGLNREELITIEIASSLCNLGKLSIPKEILLKTGSLTDEELAILKKETAYTSEILSGIDFDGPVLETITQKHEYLDGSGYPQGLSGENIILSARILSAANSFVAMTSPRAYRDKLSDKDAINQLFQDADKKYDRHVIAALFHVVENEINIANV